MADGIGFSSARECPESAQGGNFGAAAQGRLCLAELPFATI
jgi:hypothetical protein